MTAPLTDQQLAAAELHRDMFRRAIAEGGGWDYDSLEPHDFQGETTAVLAIAQMFIDGYQDNISTLLIESEQRLGELLYWEFEYREAMDNYKGEAAHAKSLRAELEQAREARLEWSRIGDHPELANWADALVGADLTPHPAFAWNSTTTGYEVAAQIATTDQLTDTARDRLLTELQAAFTETVCRVLHRSLTALPASRAGCDADQNA